MANKYFSKGVFDFLKELEANNNKTVVGGKQKPIHTCHPGACPRLHRRLRRADAEDLSALSGRHADQRRITDAPLSRREIQQRQDPIQDKRRHPFSPRWGQRCSRSRFLSTHRAQRQFWRRRPLESGGKSRPRDSSSNQRRSGRMEESHQGKAVYRRVVDRSMGMSQH